MLVFAPGLVALQFARPDLIHRFWWVSCYFAITAGVIAHNHNHCPTFANKRINGWFGNWLSLFYGYPTFAWIPTHNLNHHKFVNTEGDATITWRFTNRHNALVAATYFFVSAFYQSYPTKAFLEKTREKNPAFYRRIMFQWVFFVGGLVSLLALSIVLHGVRTGFFVFTMVIAVPAIVSLWTIHLFNYEQHVHTDPWSRHDHSRNFVSPVLNFLLFNNGLHAAHHEHPGLHWSKLPEAHAKIAPKVNPVLLQGSVWWYWLRQYVLALAVPSLGTVQLGPGPDHPPNGARIQGIASADVELGEAGTNAERVQLA